MSDIQPDFTLDLRGESCPYPVVQTLEALKTMRAGEVLEMTTDCPQSFRNIPDRIPAHGHRILVAPARAGAEMVFVIECGGKQARSK